MASPIGGSSPRIPAATSTTSTAATGGPPAATQTPPPPPASGAAAPADNTRAPGSDRASREVAAARVANDPKTQQLAAKLNKQLTGATPTATTSQSVVTADPPQVHVTVPQYSQFESGHGYTPGDTACFKSASAMAKAAGATVAGSDQRIQIGLSEDKKGKLTIDKAKAKEGTDYIDQQLTGGKPVVVGVSHADENYNADKLTDHYVVITGKGTDEQGRTFYTFHDPAVGTGNKAAGADSNVNNRFYLDADGKLYREGKAATGYVNDRRFEVSMVRKNVE